MKKSLGLPQNYEYKLWQRGMESIAGVDEVGRGAVAGPIVAAAVIFHPEANLTGINDSKQLSARARQDRFVAIIRNARAWGIGIVDHAIIDGQGIQSANRLAFRQALDRLPVRPDHIVFDALGIPFKNISSESMIKADAKVFTVAAASIVAKVFRDWLMARYALDLPGYHFERHKGYGTEQHRAAIHQLGLSPIHRKSFCKNFTNRSAQ